MASIRKRGDTFTITAYMGYDEKGRQIKKTTTYKPPDGVTEGKAEKLAKQYAAIWEDQIKGYVALDENRTFAELAKWYFDTVAPSILKEHTIQGYRATIDKHVMPRLARERLKNITPPMLDSLFTDLLKSGRCEESFQLKEGITFNGYTVQSLSDKTGIRRTNIHNILTHTHVRRPLAEQFSIAMGFPLKKLFNDVTENHGLSGATVNKIKLNLSAIFTAAVKKEILRRNPCRLATPPKIDTKPAVYMDEEQCRRFLAALPRYPDFQFEVICNVFLATGIRCGELCALHWDDIDFNTGIMNIHHTLVRLKGAWNRTQPKTEGSKRRIVLPVYVLDLLKEHRRRQFERRLKAGCTWAAMDAVFTNDSGNYLSACTLNGKLHKLCKQEGLPDLHIHSLRHTHASLLINGNFTAKVVANRLGHVNTRTTLEVYSHVFAATEEKAMQAIDMALFRKAK